MQSVSKVKVRNGEYSSGSRNSELMSVYWCYALNSVF